MAIIKCKMCGGDLNVEENSQIAVCEYCGTQQTVPKQDNEKKLTLFARANRLRFACEFDKAAGVYESIVAEFPEEAEAYWGLVLCKYGIEYVDDPATGKKVPTCHRSSFDSVLEDANFELVLEYADVVTRKIYREEAKAIEELRRGIIEVSSREEPYDIFICYKETDENGQRTLDSVLAQDLYDALTEKDYRVFFSRITLEDKLGQEYEPYIFAALNSARVMLAVGTDYEYYNAPWVKNEWSRYLQLIAAGQKKTLIPCYKNIDAYDMPKEFAKLQAQDLGKVGATQDLLRGIEKLFGKTGGVPQSAPIQVVSALNADSLLHRAEMALEDGAWNKSKAIFEKVLDLEPECAAAYLGLAMANQQKCNWAAFVSGYAGDWLQDKNLLRAKQFGGADLLNRLSKAEAIWKSKAIDLHSKMKNLAPLAGMICGCDIDTLAVQANGCVNATCSWRNVQNWIGITAVAAGGAHIVGLQTDGTVIALGQNRQGQCNVQTWEDIIAISAWRDHTVGLKRDRTVLVTHPMLLKTGAIARWSDIVAVSAGVDHVVGLKSNGTVVAEGYNLYDRCRVEGWTNIAAIATGGFLTAGLRYDGTVVATGKGFEEESEGACNVQDWSDIVAIAVGSCHTVGLKSDGRVIAVGRNRSGQCNVQDWTDIVAIAAGYNHTIGLRADGTVVAAGANNAGQCNTQNWKLFHSLDTLEQEKQVAEQARRKETARFTQEREAAQLEQKRKEEQLEHERKMAEEERKRKREAAAAEQARQRSAKIKALTLEQSALEAERSNLSGLFSWKRRKEIEKRLTQIDLEIHEMKQL